MIDRLERQVVTRLQNVTPRADYAYRDQYARALPVLALFQAALTVLLGGWIFRVAALVGDLDRLAFALVSLEFWLFVLPPILWILAFQPLRRRQLIGWRLFVIANVLSFFGALLNLAIITLLFDVAILYFAVQSYDEFQY